MPPGEGWRGPSLSVGRADHFSPGISIQRRRLPGTAHHMCCMTACPHCTHVRSQASGLIGLVRLQADPLACSKVDKHARLSPCRLSSLRNPKPSIDVRRLLRAVFASGCLTEGYGEGKRGIQRGYLTSRVDCVLACSRSPFGSLRAVRRNRTHGTDACRLQSRLPFAAGYAPSCRAPVVAPTPWLISHPAGFQLLSSSPFPRAWPIFFSFLHQHPFPARLLDFHLQSPRSAFTCICTSLSTGLPLDLFHPERRPCSPKHAPPGDSSQSNPLHSLHLSLASGLLTSHPAWQPRTTPKSFIDATSLNLINPLTTMATTAMDYENPGGDRFEG